MKKQAAILLLMSMACIPYHAFSQNKKKHGKKSTSDDEYAYTVVRNEPENAKNFTFILEPDNIDINDVNLNIGWGLTLNYNFQNKFGITAHYSQAYLEPNARPKDVTPVVPINKFSNFELGGHYYLTSETEKVDEGITVKKVGNVNYIMKIPAERLTLTAIRGGYEHINTYASGNIAWSGYEIHDPAKNVNPMDGAFGTVMDEHIIYAGYSKTKISDLAVDFTNYGEKGYSTFSGWYADLMFAPALTYADAKIKYTNPNTGVDSFSTFHVDANTPKFNFGARVGYTTGYLSTVGYDFTIEAGVRPAPDVLSGLYIMFDWGVSLNAKL
jgi:hypothetical protein